MKHDKNSGLIYGIGVNDMKDCVGVSNLRSYQLWQDMLYRCYTETRKSRISSYKNCKVSEEWKFYSNFKSDVESLNGFNSEGFQMDKDLLGDGKLYSKETVCFLPQKLNMFLVKHKERRGSLPLGVSKSKSKSKPFRARTTDENRKEVHLGHFKTPEEAHEKYLEFKRVKLLNLIEDYADRLDERIITAFLNINLGD